VTIVLSVFVVVGLLILALPVLLVAAVVVAWRRRVPVRRVLASRGVATAAVLCALAGAGATYLVGWFAGFYILDPDQMCAAAAGFYTGTPGPPDTLWEGIRHSSFPLRQTCVWADGTRYELVPGWVNPVLCTWLTAALGALALPAWRDERPAEPVGADVLR
jgi:hypothetical protein